MANQLTIKCNDFHNDNDLIEYYDKWAKRYDEDVIKERGYVCHRNGANTLHEYLTKKNIGKDCKILDVGGGTGMVGEHLKALNYNHLDSLEPSKESNDVARSKNIYQNIFEYFILPNQEVPIPSNSYDAAIAMGVFTKGHFKGENDAMKEMIRLVKPGGLVCFSIREDIAFDAEYLHQEKMKKFCDDKLWVELLNVKERYHLVGDNQFCYMHIFEVL